MSRKAHITFYIIIAVILLLITTLYFTIIKERGPEIIDPDDVDRQRYTSDVENYVDQVARDALYTGVYLISLRGGYIYYSDDKVVTENGPIAYNLKSAQVYPSKDIIESELEMFVSEYVKNNISSSRFSGEDVVFGETDADIIVGENNIILNLKMPTTVTNNKVRSDIDSYRISVPLRLGAILDDRERIINSFMDDPTSLSSSTSEQFHVRVFPFDRETLIFSVLDSSPDMKDVPLVYNFAVRYSGNSPPSLNFIPDFVTDIETPIRYNLSAQDYDSGSIIYTVDPANVELDKNTGEFIFVPQEEGTFNFRFCASDGISESCRETRVVVDG